MSRRLFFGALLAFGCVLAYVMNRTAIAWAFRDPADLWRDWPVYVILAGGIAALLALYWRLFLSNRNEDEL